MGFLPTPAVQHVAVLALVELADVAVVLLANPHGLNVQLGQPPGLVLARAGLSGLLGYCPVGLARLPCGELGLGGSDGLAARAEVGGVFGILALLAQRQRAE